MAVVAHVDRFDLSAAALRKAQSDQRAFMEGLAARLESALPNACRVTRRRDGLFSARTHVAAIAVSSDDALLRLSVERGRLRAERSRIVRGVTIRTEEIAVPEWIDALTAHVAEAGDAADATRTSLEDFLLS